MLTAWTQLLKNLNSDDSPKQQVLESIRSIIFWFQMTVLKGSESHPHTGKPECQVIWCWHRSAERKNAEWVHWVLWHPTSLPANCHAPTRSLTGSTEIVRMCQGSNKHWKDFIWFIFFIEQQVQWMREPSLTVWGSAEESAYDLKNSAE